MFKQSTPTDLLTEQTVCDFQVFKIIRELCKQKKTIQHVQYILDISEYSWRVQLQTQQINKDDIPQHRCQQTPTYIKGRPFCNYKMDPLLALTA